MPIGTGDARKIALRRPPKSLIPVDKSITVSAPKRRDSLSFLISSSKLDESDEAPILAFTLTEKCLPMIIGSHSSWLILDGITATPFAICEHTSSGVKGMFSPDLKDSRIATYSM